MFSSRYSILGITLLFLLLGGAEMLSAQPAYREKQDRLLGQSRQGDGARDERINIFKPDSFKKYAGKSKPAADDAFLRSVSEAFRPGGRRTSFWQFAALFLLIALIGAAIWYYNKRSVQRKSGYDDPHDLFLELCDAHQVDRADRHFLKTFARKIKIADVLLLFIEPRYFDAALTEPLFSNDFSILLRLRTRFFGPPDAKKSPTTSPVVEHRHDSGTVDGSENANVNMPTMVFQPSGVTHTVGTKTTGAGGTSFFTETRSKPTAAPESFRRPRTVRELGGAGKHGPAGMSLTGNQGPDWLQSHRFENAWESISEKLAEMSYGIHDWLRRGAEAIGKRFPGFAPTARQPVADRISYRPERDAKDAGVLLAACDPQMLESRLVEKIAGGEQEETETGGEVLPDYPNDVALMERLLAKPG